MRKKFSKRLYNLSECMGEAWIKLEYFSGGLPWFLVRKLRNGSYLHFVVLTMVFAVLKLVNVIDWSWHWVVSPLWLPTAFYLAGFLVSTILLSVFWIFIRLAMRILRFARSGIRQLIPDED